MSPDHSIISPDKPIIEILPLSQRPYKAYTLSLLHTHIQAIQPATALDAGCGDLFNRWMFPGEYVGITLSKHWYLRGLARPENKDLKSKVYAMRLEGDLSFLGTFDLCVCTNTIDRVDDPVECLGRISDRVKKGGAMIFDAGIKYWPDGLRQIENQYEFIDVVFAGLEECFRLVPYGELHSELMRKEMMAPNTPEGHSQFYVFAHGKIPEPTPAQPPPSIVYDSSLAIVEKDIPRLLE